MTLSAGRILLGSSAVAENPSEVALIDVSKRITGIGFNGAIISDTGV